MRYLKVKDDGTSESDASQDGSGMSNWGVCKEILRPLFDSDKRRKTIRTLFQIFIFVAIQVSCLTYYAKLQKSMMTALQQKDADEFYSALRKTGVLIICVLPGIAGGAYGMEGLKLMARAKITHDLVKGYLSEDKDGGSVFYRMQRSESQIDNPDQRILSDSASLVDRSFGLFFEVLITVGTSFGMIGVLWKTSPSVCCGMLCYAICGCVVSTKVFGPLVLKYNNELLKQEANLRYVLIRTRENAEQVAFFKGGARELASFVKLFGNFMHTAYWSRRVVQNVQHRLPLGHLRRGPTHGRTEISPRRG